MRAKNLFVISIMLIGCTAAKGRRDEWIRPIPGQLAAEILSAANQVAVTPVASEKRASAAEVLAKSSSVELSLIEAESLTGKTLEAGHYFLIRGVCLGCGTGSFKAYCDGRNILIDHHSLARSGVSPTRWPVIARIESPPEEIFVECAAAR